MTDVMRLPTVFVAELSIALALAMGIGCAPSASSSSSRTPDSESPQLPPLSGPPTNPQEARLHLAALLQKNPSFSRQPNSWWDRLERGENWDVRKQTYADALDRIEDTLMESERATAAVVGEIDDLRRKGPCWKVEDLNGFAALVAYLDATTGELVFVWAPPEG